VTGPVSFPVFVVVNWRRERVHGITTDREQSRQWCRDIVAQHDDPLANLAATQTVAVVSGPPEPAAVTDGREVDSEPDVHPVPVSTPPDQGEPAPSGLRRMRLELPRHGSDLMLVGDHFGEGGRYIQCEILRVESESWSWLDWDDLYDRMAAEWRSRYSAVSPGVES